MRVGIQKKNQQRLQKYIINPSYKALKNHVIIPLIQLVLAQSFSQLPICIIVEIYRDYYPDAIQKNKYEPKILQIKVGVECRWPVL